ncbi:MAG TPA: DUF4388 domain-containing protein [Blastocatellia bacterium]|nr:DUF4388 domain-containing protein [Blastocatellia bacterium]
MELSGDLSDFALTDILQILSLSRKTGTLLLEAGECRGRLVIEQGCITHASLVPGETIVDRLVKERRIDDAIWRELKRIGDHDDGLWSLETLLIESGVIKKKEFELLARRYIEDVVASLISLGKGRFWIELNQVGLLSSSQEIKLEEGLEVGEVLLQVARESDESSMRNETSSRKELASDNADLNSWMDMTDRSDVESVGRSELELSFYLRSDDERRGKKSGKGISNLCSLLMELRSHSFEAEVSLLVMRYASDVASRGVLFVVREDVINGVGQFGVNLSGGKDNPDQIVRNISVSLGQGSVFDSVIQSGQPYIGALPEDPWIVDILFGLGGVSADLSIFLLPIVCQGKTVFIIYGDNYPGNYEMDNIDELIALTNQASVVLEKIILEKLVGDMMTN